MFISVVGVKFWRICLDEVQMVEGSNLAAQLARRLSSRHKWGVSGTPIQRGLGFVLFFF